jgi:phage protein D
VAKKVVRGKKTLQVQRERAGSWTKAKRAEMCAQLAASCNVAASCRAVGMSQQGFYKLLRRDAVFRAECDAAVAEIYGRLELAVLERQLKGRRKPVFHAGKQVATITEYSDAIALALLRAHRERAERGAGAGRRQAEEAELARLRIEAKLTDMNRRMGGQG